MEFRFAINKLLPKKINKVTHTLIPEDFRGDRRELNECVRQMSRVLDEMGEASAKAQGLNRTITSASKLRDTDHILYLMVDSEGNNGMGSVVGLLKTGSKHLFMFDEMGAHYQLKPRCILDFYIHESRQRMGLGKTLYQHMLTEENIQPVKLAIDRPSEKFLAFLEKHYGLNAIIPQNNKFVVFQGFFDDEEEDTKNARYGSHQKVLEERSSSINNIGRNSNSNCGTPMTRSAYGRYAAARPQCSMGNIIHNTAGLGRPAEYTGKTPNSETPKVDRPRSLSIYSEDDQKQIFDEVTSNVEDEIVDEPFEEPISIPDHELEHVLHVDEKPDSPTPSIKSTTPSCSQEVSGNQPAHLDLKFYHSPLW